MRITIYTSLTPNWLTRHKISRVLQEFDQVQIIGIDTSHTLYKKERFEANKRLIKRRGWSWFLKKQTDRFALKKCYADWNVNVAKAKKEGTQFLNEAFEFSNISYTVNGAQSEELITASEPDILIQADAGILRSNIFSIPENTTLNVHAAIAPRLRGGSSIFWAHYFGRPDWLGVTVHQIDKGIDTGAIYQRKFMEYEPGKHPAYKFVESCSLGAEMLVETLHGIHKGHLSPHKIDEEGVYYSFFKSKDYIALQENNWLPLL